MPAADLTNATWRKSSRSNGGGNECVEIASLTSGAAVRDSKDPGAGALVLTPCAWDSLRAAVRQVG
ncbi:protein of unknown function [Amycolatopsis marina]|uniref:DUF397 domain-containing protein n=1 Tax=Amycolatopsis marina TaxID=490629 RepID=A0A1I1CM21_9PSEU|nr:DUF397 domain-containing protein [Amycolatopsis marina]SFB61968.1 protein of unknown function [Amycolatopsis marina]